MFTVVKIIMIIKYNYTFFPAGDVFAAVLSLFMGDGDQPLPTDAEVIICDEKTTAEEVNQVILALTFENECSNRKKQSLHVRMKCYMHEIFTYPNILFLRIDALLVYIQVMNILAKMVEKKW